MRLYGVAGKKQCGKNTLCDFASELLYPQNIIATNLALADPLKQFCLDYLGVSRKNLSGSDFEKNQWVNTWKMFTKDIRDKWQKNEQDNISAREVMQVVGTEIFRHSFGEDFWTNLLYLRIQKIKKSNDNTVIFVTDVRFPNEIEAIKKWGGKVIKIYRNIKREETITHDSEMSLDNISDEEYDYVIQGGSNRSMKQLKDATFKILYNEGFFQGGYLVS